jgi:hypothetical protein
MTLPKKSICSASVANQRGHKANANHFEAEIAPFHHSG